MSLWPWVEEREKEEVRVWDGVQSIKGYKEIYLISKTHLTKKIIFNSN